MQILKNVKISVFSLVLIGKSLIKITKIVKIHVFTCNPLLSM